MKSTAKQSRTGLSDGMKALGRRPAIKDGDLAEVSAEHIAPGYFLENYYTGAKRGPKKPVR